MDVLQINYWDFFLQSLGLATWVCIVAGIYAVVEKAVEGNQSQAPTQP
jgi:hypothetical protein